jgi:hypothetical protein
MFTTHNQKLRYLDSVWRSTFSEFRDYINGITEKSITIQDALDTIREAICLPKKYYLISEGNNNKTITVQDIAYNNKQIAELFDALRKGMQPESLNLPFKKIKDREKQLVDQLTKYKKDRIDVENAYTKIAIGHFPPLNTNEKAKEVDINERSFYYWIEAAIAPLNDLTSDDDAGKLEFIGCINGTPPLDGGMSYFENGDYYWTNNAGNFVHAIGIRDLLASCGFSTHINFSQRRKASILLLNLQTPCAEWQGSAGKTRINLEPYQNLIAETVSKLAYKIPSLHGKGIHTIWDTGLGGIYKPFLVDFLKTRHKQISRNPSDAVKDRLTQSGAWYRERPKMIAAGFKPRKFTMDSKGREIYDWNAVRKGFTSSINKVIKELWPDGSVTRESLGIVAKARAMLYINGQVYPVSFDSKEELARLKVTDMIIVEKEGVTDVLLNAAQKYRIALVATAGHFTEYVTDLMRLASEIGHINVCVLTDYDIDGINMWRIANEKMGINIKRIGITQDVVKWLQENGYADIRLEDVEEEYSPNPKLFISEDDSYLQVKRIELDSIIQKVGPEVFWKYIVHQLETEFPGPRDYREIVPEPKPEDYYPDKINESLKYIAKYTKQVYTPKWEEIKESQLKEVKGLLHVDAKKDEIDESLRHIVQEEDKGIQKIIAKLEELRESGELPELKENEKEYQHDKTKK